MEQVADGVFRLRGFPSGAFNCYLVDGVLIDARTRHAAGRILRELRGHDVVGHALTHAHADHQGSSAAVCEALGLPLMCGLRDAATVESGNTLEAVPPHPINRLQLRFWAGPGHPVDQVLREGDALGSFEVLETPGHSPGHVAFWRERDRVLLAGDVLFNRSPVLGRTGLHEPPEIFTLDPVANRASARRLAALRPRIACFGHGAVLRDPGLLADFVDTLAEPGE
jgi:hydroxyacylglutathione hydrolase